MLSITDEQAFALVNLRERAIFFIHTGSEEEARLIYLLQQLATLKPSLALYELHVDNITAPEQTLFAFVRYPRLQVYIDKTNEVDLVGFQAIEEWVEQQR